MRLEDDVVLEPRELCDLMNYVLGYCVAEKSSRRIEVFVVKTWKGKRGRRRVQSWCEEVLRSHRVLERKVRPLRHERDLGGSRPISLVPPQEIRGFCGSTAELATILGVDEKTLWGCRWAEKFSRIQAHINGGQDGPNFEPIEARL